MSTPELGSVSKAIAQIGEMEEEAAQLLWERFFEKLCRYAEKKVYKRHRRLLDAEDIASSAMFALMEGLKNGRFYKLKNRDQLWQMLVIIASRKAANAAKFHDRQKRGLGKTRGDSAFKGISGGLAGYIEGNDDPAKFVELEADCQELLEALPDENYRSIAVMRLAGFTNVEIGKKLNCSTRTIDRKLLAIREVWSDLNESDF